MDGSMLAVASNDNFIDLYDVEAGYKYVAVCSGHSSFVTHIQWSADGSVLQSVSGDYEILYWDGKTGQQHKDKSKMRDVEWETWKCILGWPVIPFEHVPL
jgi:WD40 repeat protein